MNCKHNKIKKIITHGNKSKGYLVCKECGEIVSAKDLKEKRNAKRQRRK